MVSPGPAPSRQLEPRETWLGLQCHGRENGLGYSSLPPGGYESQESCLGQGQKKNKCLPIWVALGKSLPFCISVSSPVNEVVRTLSRPGLGWGLYKSKFPRVTYTAIVSTPYILAVLIISQTYVKDTIFWSQEHQGRSWQVTTPLWTPVSSSVK